MQTDKANSALLAIPTPADRDTWLKITMAYKAEGGNFETWDEWSKRGDGYNERGNRDTWRSITDGGITGATLYAEARANGWTPPQEEYYRPQRTAPRRAQAQTTPPHERKRITDYINAAGQRRGEIMDYCKARGIDADTANRFNLGYDADTKRLVIPYPGADYYAARSMTVAPNAGRKDSTEAKYIFPSKGKAGERPVFNAPALTSGAKTVFITEGQIDAISIEQYGGAAIGCNAQGVILNALDAAGEALTAEQFLIIPDNDTDENGKPDTTKGAKTAETIAEALTAAGYEAYIYPLPANYHDVNDMATRNSADLWELIQQGATYAEQQRRAKIEQHKQTSAAARLADLEKAIERNATQEAIKTGYPTLDNILGDRGYPGGLYPGLYIIGAISSLGKTTFSLQMADQIAATGQDVLIFSLEMSTVELMAKSISRLTYYTADDERDRKTTRGILAGARYARYNPGELETIRRAKAQYKEIAEHLYITEAMGNIGAGDIRAIVKRHVDITGKRPVVFIDYLQILAPEDTKATEKQNTDRAVVELKRISRDFDIPVIAISSFNRENYKNEVAENSFKESGAIEYSSDVLIGLQFKGAGKKGFDVRSAKAKTPRDIELVILKNRNGAIPKDPLEFNFYPLVNYFEDVNNGAVVPEEYAPAVAVNIADLMKKRK